jgi:hypothetical protein
LKAAAKAPRVKRVVITSSLVALVDARFFFAEDTPLGTIWDEPSSTPFVPGPRPSTSTPTTRPKSPLLAATGAFLTGKPGLGFDVVSINPSSVIAKNGLIADAKDVTLGTNLTAFAAVAGIKSRDLLVRASVHAADVAFMHVRTLAASAVPAGTCVANRKGAEGTVWQDVTEIMARRLFGAVESGVLANDGRRDTRKLPVDVQRAERVMGFKFKSYEEQVVSVTERYLELAGGK